MGAALNHDFSVIYLRVVQGCNLNCAHCFTAGNRDPYLLLDHKHARQFLRAIHKNVHPKKAVVYIHGGETFMSPREHLSAINQIVHEELPYTKIDIIPQTNLMYPMDSSFVDFIREEYNSQIGVSWDHKIRFSTTDKSLNEDLFFKNFRTLVDHQLEVAIAITVQKHLLRAPIEEILPRFEGAVSLDFEFLTMFDDKTRHLQVNNDEWSEFLFRVVKYYVNRNPTWSMPQIDLFTKSLIENKIYSCKGNCCQNQTFTLNANGSVGLCPDQAYFSPIAKVEDMASQWNLFENKIRELHLLQMIEPIHDLCASCEFFEICGGNCERSLFTEGSLECPLSKATLRFQRDNLGVFERKLKKAKENLIELRA